METLLISLGYKEADKGKWLKPVGKSLLTFETDTNMWTNWFIDMFGKQSIWESEQYYEERWVSASENPEPFHAFIIYKEAYSKYSWKGWRFSGHD